MQKCDEKFEEAWDAIKKEMENVIGSDFIGAIGKFIVMKKMHEFFKDFFKGLFEAGWQAHEEQMKKDIENAEV